MKHLKIQVKQQRRISRPSSTSVQAVVGHQATGASSNQDIQSKPIQTPEQVSATPDPAVVAWSLTTLRKEGRRSLAVLQVVAHQPTQGQGHLSGSNKTIWASKSRSQILQLTNGPTNSSSAATFSLIPAALSDGLSGRLKLSTPTQYVRYAISTEALPYRGISLFSVNLCLLVQYYDIFNI